MKSAYLAPFLVVPRGHDVVKRYAAALVADAAYGHKRTCHRSNLKDRLDVSANAAVGEIQLALAKVGNGPTVSYQEVSASPAAR